MYLIALATALAILQAASQSNGDKQVVPRPKANVTDRLVIEDELVAVGKYKNKKAWLFKRRIAITNDPRFGFTSLVLRPARVRRCGRTEPPMEPPSCLKTLRLSPSSQASFRSRFHRSTRCRTTLSEFTLEVGRPSGRNTLICRGMTVTG
jgi:hypothetical protein